MKQNVWGLLEVVPSYDSRKQFLLAQWYVLYELEFVVNFTYILCKEFTPGFM